MCSFSRESLETNFTPVKCGKYRSLRKTCSIFIRVLVIYTYDIIYYDVCEYNQCSTRVNSSFTAESSFAQTLESLKRFQSRDLFVVHLIIVQYYNVVNFHKTALYTKKKKKKGEYLLMAYRAQESFFASYLHAHYYYYRYYYYCFILYNNITPENY